MARTAIRLVVAAMLALLSSQAAVPSFSAVAAFEVVCRTQAEQKTPRVRPVGPALRNRPAQPEYVSFVGCETDRILLYQLPPPVSPFVV
jgi:hypothetical protein